MKTCHVCGCLVDDKEIVCPDCGATVVKATSGLSLKANEPEKKKRTNPIGTTIGTGSGLTDILRAADDDGVAEDDPFNGGSIPVSIIRNTVDDDEETHKKKSKGAFSMIVKIICLLAVAFGVYLLVVNVFMKKDEQATYESALDTFISAVNNNDAALMAKLVPTYMNDSADVAEMWIDDLNGADITEYDIIAKEQMEKTDLTDIEEYVKLELNKSVEVRDGVELTVEFRGTSYNNAGNAVSRGGDLKLQFIQIKDKWYFYPDNFNNSLLTK